MSQSAPRPPAPFDHALWCHRLVVKLRFLLREMDECHIYCEERESAEALLEEYREACMREDGLLREYRRVLTGLRGEDRLSLY